MGRRITSDDIPASGSVPNALRSLSAASAAVSARWASSGALGDQTRARMGETVARFAQRLEAAGIESFALAGSVQARAFIAAHTAQGAPELATMHARRTALRTLYRTLRELGLADGDPTLDVYLPPRGQLAARPLTDDEVTLCRISAYGDPARWTPIRAVAWALAEATAVSSELAAVRICDLDTPRGPHGVALQGTRRHDPRSGTLTPWGSRVLDRRVRELTAAGADPRTPLAYTGRTPPRGPKAQSAICNALAATLKLAGLADERDVRPTSLRHWAGRALYDAGARIDQVALALGHRSLDETAIDIGLDWRQTRNGRKERA